MRILQICLYSEGACGVWQRVKQDSIELIKRGYEVSVFSSNLVKGSSANAVSNVVIDDINIFRFKPKFKLGENYMFFNFKERFFSLKPNVVIVHVYRHPHTHYALKLVDELRKEKNVKIFIVTHAPFVDDKLRSLFFGFGVKAYDLLFSKTLNKFDKVFTIATWEKDILLKFGVNPKKVVYLPNNVPSQFFKVKSKKYQGKKVLFLGRVAPVKDVDVLIKAFSLIEGDFVLKIVGPKEEAYWNEISGFSDSRIEVLDAVYDLNDKIKLMNECDVFVLPSKREGMPLSLIEAMSLGKLVISSANEGARDLIDDGKNGFVFPIGNVDALKKRLEWCFDSNNFVEIERICLNAKEFSKQFDIGKIVDKLEDSF